jgi:hypothetical protein
MMAWGAHRHECVLRGPAHDFIDCQRDSPDTMRDRGEAFRAHGRVGIEVGSPSRGGRGLDRISIIRWVHPQDGGAINAGGIHPAQQRETRLIEGLRDRADAVGAFWMTRSGIVIETSGVAQKKRCHNRNPWGLPSPPYQLWRWKTSVHARAAHHSGKGRAGM